MDHYNMISFLYTLQTSRRFFSHSELEERVEFLEGERMTDFLGKLASSGMIIILI